MRYENSSPPPGYGGVVVRFLDLSEIPFKVGCGLGLRGMRWVRIVSMVMCTRVNMG